MKKWVGMLLSLVMVLCMMTPSFAATAADQVVNKGETWYYDADGKRVTGNNVQFPGGAAVVELSKTVQPVSAGTENEFEVELKVRTTEKLEELQSDSPDAAVMLILDVSTSMSSCVHCGTYGGHNDYANGYGTLHEYVDRLTLTKEAAIDFLYNFKATAENTDDKRWVSIVIYGPTATRELAWVNVNDESQMETAKDVLSSIELSSTGGTNIEGALMLGANIWENADGNMDKDIAATIRELDYKYTILLTDGEPTWNVTGTSNSTSRITGNNGGGYGTNYDDAKDVGVQAERLRKLPGLPKLYSICYGYTRSGGQVNYVFNDTPFTGFSSDQRNSANPQITGKNMTVGEWLGAFSTRAYNGSANQSINDLLDTFDSVMEQIKLAAEAWRVTDVMGEHVKYISAVSDPTYRNSISPANIVDELTWNILGSEGTYEEQTVGGTKYGVLTFVHKYIIQLDNLDNVTTDSTPAYTAGATDTNESAKLLYAVKSEESGLWETVDHEVAFPVPQVKGFAGNLEFTKVWKENDQEKALEGVKFTLTSKDTSEEGHPWTATATSDVKGTVKFENIPSGHVYELIETEIPEVNGKHFANMNPMDVAVSWGNVTSGIEDGKILNKWANESVTLTLKKEFGAGNKYTPDEIELTLSGPTGGPNYASGNVELTKEDGWTVTLSGLTPGEYTIFENGAVDGYDLVKSATLNGVNIATSDFNSWKVPLTLNEGESHQNFAVVVTNTYTQQVGNVSVTKAFKERAHDDLIDNEARPDMVDLDPSLYAGKEIKIVLTPVKGGEAKTITLNSGNGWSDSLNNIPVGEYIIEENSEIQIADHDFVHLHVLVNGQELTGKRITVSQDTTITLAVENHYSHHLGQIEVMKDFEGIDPADVPEDMTFTVNVYKAKQSGNEYVKDGTTPVTTITVRRMDGPDGVSFVWSGTASRLPVGHYWLEEATPEAIDGYTFNNVSFASQVVEVKHNAVARATLTNTYQQQMGNLTVKKVFRFPTENGEPGTNFHYPEYITVNVLEGSHSGDVYTTLELRGTTTPAWTASIDLPVGTYYLSEVTAEGVPGTADVANHGVTATWSSSANVTIANGADEERTVTNTYTHDYGHLTISKEFVFEGVGEDEKPALTGKAVEFVIYRKDGQTNKEVDTVTLTDGTWEKTVSLPLGTYYVYEKGARNAFTDYTLTSVDYKIGDGTFENWYNVNTDVTNLEGFQVSINDQDATISLSAKNTYTRDKANLTIQKEFAGDLDATAFADKSITVGIYNGETLVQNVTLNQDNSWSATVTGLDTGVAYTLMEDRNSANSANVDGYNLLVQWSKGATVTLEKGDNVTNVVTNTYTQQKGTLRLQKHFDGIQTADQELLANTTITVNVTDKNGKTETIALPKNGRWYDQITLPIGEYTLTETAITVGGYDHEDAVFAGTGVTDGGADKLTATVEVTENTTVNVQLTNTMKRHTGSLTITKEFTDDSEKVKNWLENNNRTINVLVKRNGEVYRTVTLPVTNADGSKTWSFTLDDVPTGDYTVEEVTAPGAAGSAHVNNHGLTVTYSGGNTAVTVTEGKTAEKTITNKYTQHVGNIIVNKEFAGETSKIAEDNIPNSGIAIHLYNEDGGIVDTGYVSRENGGSHIFVELPVGTYYLVEETGEGKPGTAWVDGYELAEPQWDGSGTLENGKYKVEVKESATATLTVTNTYTRNGSLSVEKKFGICDTCGAVRPASVKVQLYRVPAEGTTAAELVGEPVVLNAGNNWHYTWPGLEAGEYSVREVEGSAEIANHTLSVSYDQENVTVAQDTTVTAIITNTYTHVKGSLTIEKKFDQNSELNETYFADKQISFQVKGPGNSAQTITLPTAEGKWEYTLTDLPVGDYTVEEVGAQVPGYGLSVTYNGVATGAVQVVAATEGTVPAKMTVTNTYTKTTGELKITKAFANGSALDGDDFSVIDVDILHKDGTTYRQIVLEAAKDWTWVGTLPLGEYIVREVTTPGEAGSAYRAGYGLNVEYSDEAKNGSVTVSVVPAQITITNHYTYVPVYGSLMIKKEFKGEPSLYPASVEFTITGPGYSQTVIVSATNNWTAYIGGLSGGEYTVTEAQVSGADYDLTTTWSSQGGKIYVYPGQTAAVTCTNAYYYKDTVSFRIPVEKTVHLGGSKAPAGAMQFSFGAAWQGDGGVTVRFENDPANTLGAFQQTSANTYAATLNGPGTVKGCIVIEGYAEQLAGFKLQTWENLTGYTDEEAAAAAGWTFDKTATDGAVNWNVEIGYNGQNGLGASIARTDTGLAGKVSFDNAYTSPVEVPETGDGENLALWIALCTFSALGVAVLLISHKRKAIMANR